MRSNDVKLLLSKNQISSNALDKEIILIEKADIDSGISHLFKKTTEEFNWTIVQKSTSSYRPRVGWRLYANRLYAPPAEMEYSLHYERTTPPIGKM